MVGMLLLFYVFQGLHWWANFELGIHGNEMSTAYNLIIFGTAIIVITIMLILGAGVNKKKLTHEFYVERISEEKQRLSEEQAKQEQKERNEAKVAEGLITKNSWIGSSVIM